MLLKGLHLSGYDIDMRCRLVLQLPTADLRRAQIVAATDDPKAIQAFADSMTELAQQTIDQAPDPFLRELAYIEKRQLQARLRYALHPNGDESP